VTDTTGIFQVVGHVGLVGKPAITTEISESTQGAVGGEPLKLAVLGAVSSGVVSGSVGADTTVVDLNVLVGK
jgi:hypothetical protein